MDSDQPLDHEARLQLITNMINQAKGNIQYSAFYFFLYSVEDILLAHNIRFQSMRAVLFLSVGVP